MDIRAANSANALLQQLAALPVQLDAAKLAEAVNKLHALGALTRIEPAAAAAAIFCAVGALDLIASFCFVDPLGGAASTEPHPGGGWHAAPAAVAPTAAHMFRLADAAACNRRSCWAVLRAQGGATRSRLRGTLA